ncbi:MAG TPA: APC family permease [Candidatus Dormibacteraeota bacterium]|nr:APC family permease [Candidatus Dormibacteraeota bacterium]
MSVIGSTAASRRRIKVRGGSLGWYLCWAVVFADIGTSVYYVPGILYHQYSTRSALFVGMTLIVFVLLTFKYTEVSWRYPEGGGVVTVSSRALHPFAGLLGGLFILVDYFLTVAISAVSGIFYLAVVAPSLGPARVAAAVTIFALLLLGVLNWLGIKESARVSATFATLAAGGQLLVVLATAVYLGPAGIVDSFRALGHGPSLGPLTLLTGYAAAFLAFSGLESISQLAPAIKEPRRVISREAMIAVALTIAVTSPLLTLWSTTLLHGTIANESQLNQFVSLLGARAAGQALGAYVAISGSILLIFASNTGIIGAYHVFIALSRMGFLPRFLEVRNSWRKTPHWAILIAVGLPIILVAVTAANTSTLGDLYAFGLLGAFILTCLSLDIVRWREGQMRPALKTLAWRLGFGVGVLTTVLVAVAWMTNLVNKPLATEFGGGLVLLGLVIGLLTYAYGRQQSPVVFPFLHHPDLPILRAPRDGQLPACEVLVILPHDIEGVEAVLAATERIGRARSFVFLYRGDRPTSGNPELFEVDDPYLKDRAAQAVFARAERLARKSIRDRRYVYVPGNLRREAVGDVWKTLMPRETLIVDGDQDVLPPIALERVRRPHVEGVPVLHLLTGRPRRAATGAS